MLLDAEFRVVELPLGIGRSAWGGDPLLGAPIGRTFSATEGLHSYAVMPPSTTNSDPVE